MQHFYMLIASTSEASFTEYIMNTKLGINKICLVLKQNI